MQHGLSRRSLGSSAVAVVGTFGILRHARGEGSVKLRVSLDTAPSHIRNVSIVDYLKQLEAATGGKITSEVFHSGQLYPDLNVGKALLQGQVDMAAPGAWTQTGIVSDCDFCQLPVFYGRPVEVTEHASDGKPGALIVKQIETKLRVKVIGPWLDLGFQNWYTTKKPLNSTDDLRGMKIRSPGGAGISWRINFFGGIPNTTAWPNVPLALSQGTFDGLVSSNESLVSAKLWDSGVKYALEDHQFIAEYIPLTSQVFWDKLTPDLQKMMTDVWAQNVPIYRANMAAAQTKARTTLEEHGVKFADPTAEQSAAQRKRMVAEQEQMAKEIKVSPDMVKLIMAEAGSGS